MTRIKESHPMPESECEEMLRYQFYLSLNDDKLVTALRHRCDDGNSFKELFTYMYAKKVEFAFSQKSKMIFRDKTPSVAQKAADSEKLVLQKIEEITQKLATIDSRLAKVESQKLPVSGQINKKKDSQGNSILKCTSVLDQVMTFPCVMQIVTYMENLNTCDESRGRKRYYWYF